MPSDNLTRVSAEETAHLLARAQAALALAIPNAASARYANVRNGPGGAICGEVEAGGAGVLHPFVLLPGGEAMVSAAPDLRLEDPNDPFPDLYMRHCASIEELRRIGERLDRSGSLSPRLPPVEPPPDAEPLDIREDEPAPPRVERPAPRGDDNSFFNAVVRAPPQTQAAPRDR